MTVYVNARTQQHQDGREEQQRQVAAITATMRPIRRTVTYRKNEVTGRLEEVR